MNSIKFLIILLLSEVFTLNVFTQDTIPYPSMKEVEPHVTVSVIGLTGGGYRYDYAVSNGGTALQQIRDFMVQIQNATVQSVAPTDWWASRATQQGLVATTWTSLDSAKDIKPDSSLSGFQVQSAGLPTIVQFYTLGRIPIPYGEYIPADGTDDPFINSAQGRTISPTNPPTPFNGLNFLDTIKSYINQSRSLGWITNQSTADKYTRLIDSARANLQANNRGVTKAKLDSVLLNANADSASTLTSEAYALLRFNTEYVMKKLREEDELLDNKKK